MLLVALLAVGLVLPAAALAQDNSAIDEYTESVPGAGGDHPSHDQGGGGSGGGGDGGASLPQSNADALESEGAAATAAANLAEATAPDRPAGAGSVRDPGANESASSSGGESQDDAGQGAPSIGDVVGGVTGGSDSDGLGIWLLVILGATLVAAIALALARWRRGPGEPTQA